jgi:hypothetical protein
LTPEVELPADELVALLGCLSTSSTRTSIISSQAVWKFALGNLGSLMEDGLLDYEHLYSIVKYCGPNFESCKLVSSYATARGYDNEELAALGIRRAVNMIKLLAESEDHNIKSAAWSNLTNHFKAFISEDLMKAKHKVRHSLLVDLQKAATEIKELREDASCMGILKELLGDSAERESHRKDTLSGGESDHSDSESD